MRITNKTILTGYYKLEQITFPYLTYKYYLSAKAIVYDGIFFKKNKRYEWIDNPEKCEFNSIFEVQDYLSGTWYNILYKVYEITPYGWNYQAGINGMISNIQC